VGSPWRNTVGGESFVLQNTHSMLLLLDYYEKHRIGINVNQIMDLNEDRRPVFWKSV